MKEFILNTKNIVTAISDAIRTNDKLPSYNGNFDSWLDSYRKVENELYEQIHILFNPEKELELKSNFPLRENILKLIIKNVYGIMPFNKEYVLKNYQLTYQEKNYLVYPSKNTEKLIIFMTGYVSYTSYNRFSWYFDETEQWNTNISYLFLCDPERHWYVGTDGKPEIEIYAEIIRKTIKEIGIHPNNVYIIGASMGGYGAILLGTKLKLGGIISIHPQLSYKGTLRHNHRLWSQQILECGLNFFDIDDFFSSQDYIPPIYLEISRNKSDEYGLESVINELNKKNTLFIIKRHESLVHETKSPNRDKINTLIDFFCKSKSFDTIDTSMK